MVDKKLKKDILDICLLCLSIKNKMLVAKEVSFSCYIGGGRQYHSEEAVPYRRTIYLGRDSVRYSNVPEEVIDLNEVYFLYKRDKGLFDWPDNYFSKTFCEVIDVLVKDNLFSLIDYNDLKDENYSGHLYKDYLNTKGSKASNLSIRFIKLIK